MTIWALIAGALGGLISTVPVGAREDRSAVFLGSSSGLDTVTPAPHADDVDLYDAIKLHFSRLVTAGPGMVELRRDGDSSASQTIAATSASGLGGAVIRLSPSERLQPGTTYLVTVSPDAFMFEDGSAFEGVSSADGWTFTTRPLRAAKLALDSDNAAFKAVFPITLQVYEPPRGGVLELVVSGRVERTIPLSGYGRGSHSLTLDARDFIEKTENERSPDGTYSLAVVMHDASSNERLESPDISVCIDTVRPATPVITRSDAVDSRPSLTWEHTASQGCSKDRYRVEWSRDAHFDHDVQTAEVTATNYASESPLEGLWYFRVVAVDGAGNVSEASEMKTIAVEPSPEPTPEPVHSSVVAEIPKIIPITPTISVLSTRAITQPESRVRLNDFDNFSSGDGVRLTMEEGQSFEFTSGGMLHSAFIAAIEKDKVTVSIDRKVYLFRDALRHDADGDGKADITISLLRISGNLATLLFAETGIPADANVTSSGAQGTDSPGGTRVIVTGGALLAAGVLGGSAMRLRKRFGSSADG